MATDYFNSVAPTYIENWPTALYPFSLQQKAIVLKRDEIYALIRINQQFLAGDLRLDLKAEAKVLDELGDKLADNIQYFGNEGFVRLGSRSAKDSFYALSRGLRVSDKMSALKMLASGSARIIYDLKLALQNNYSPSIFIREWRQIDPLYEFRCFIQKGKLVGISQYDCQIAVDHQFEQNVVMIKPSIEHFISHISPLLSAGFAENVVEGVVEDIVVDVFLTADFTHNEQGLLKVVLLELNPFIASLDCCLFQDELFDSSFRYLIKNDNQPHRRIIY